MGLTGCGDVHVSLKQLTNWSLAPPSENVFVTDSVICFKLCQFKSSFKNTLSVIPWPKTCQTGCYQVGKLLL